MESLKLDDVYPVTLAKGARVPEKAHPADAGYDLFCMERIVLRKHDRVDIDTGVGIGIPNGVYGSVESKSGLNFNEDIMCTGGVIDPEYTGTIHVKLLNYGGNLKVFEAGDKIAQIIFMPFLSPSLVPTSSLGETERGAGGFGSTGR